ncbi:MAG: hypothetical protein AAFY47_05320 [Pseudomonadota bacterium]
MEWIRQRAVMVIALFTGLGACAGCAGPQITQTQGAVERLYGNAEGPLGEFGATLELWHVATLAAEEQCFDVPEAERAPLITCQGAEKAINATEGLVQAGALVLGEAEAAIAIYEAYDVTKGEQGLIAAQVAATEAMGQAISFWTQRRPELSQAIGTIGKVDREDPA